MESADVTLPQVVSHVRPGRLAVAAFVLLSAGAAAAQPPQPGPAPTGGQPSMPSSPTAPGPPSMPGGQTTTPRPGQPAGPIRDPRGAPTTNATGTAVIKGRVVSMEGGTPLRRVQVRLMGQPLRMPRGVLTDAQGNYTITELPAGRFQISATKGGYVTLEYGQRRPLDSGRPLEIADGQTIDKIDFSLPRGAVITGRVVDELGEPVTDSMVSAMLFRRVAGRRRLVPAGNTRPASTNDVGQFRLFGLPPGDYYIAAGVVPGMFSFMDSSVESGTGYAPTYYPGTPSIAEAQRVTVNIGEEQNIDLQLVPTRVSKISGTVVDASGRPALNGMVMLQPRDEVATIGGGAGAPLREGGNFLITNAAPGAYHLTVMSMGTEPDTREAATIPITVTGQPIEDLRIATSRGASIHGRVTYEGGDPPAAGTTTTRLACTSNDPSAPTMMGGAMGAITEQHQFEIKGAYVPCLVRAFTTGGTWTLKAVLHEGQDVTDRPLAISGGKAVTGVEVVITNRQTTLTGTVTDGDGRPLKEYAVVVFPDDKEKWMPMSRFIGRARPDQQGQFKVTGIPPGEYLAVALETLEMGIETDPEFLERVQALGTRTRLSEDVPQAITLKLSAPPAQ